MEREREQRVASKDCNRLAENFVASWFAAAQIVVIECRKVIVNQRVGVDEFEGASAGIAASGSVANIRAASR